MPTTAKPTQLATKLEELPLSARAVHMALTDHPGGTAAQLAEHADVGRSTAAKALTAMETAGLVTRTVTTDSTATGRRRADTWNVVSPGRRAAKNPTLAPTESRSSAPRATAASSEESVSTPTKSARARVASSAVTAPTDAITRSTTSAATGGKNPPAIPTRATKPTRRPATLPVGKLHKGELQQLVLDQVHTDPAREWSPGDLGRMLERSQGAIVNALERFTDQGQLERSSEAPRRYRVAPAESIPGPDDSTGSVSGRPKLVGAGATGGRRSGRGKRK